MPYASWTEHLPPKVRVRVDPPRPADGPTKRSGAAIWLGWGDGAVQLAFSPGELAELLPKLTAALEEARALNEAAEMPERIGCPTCKGARTLVGGTCAFCHGDGWVYA